MELADAFLPFGWRILFHICNLPLILYWALKSLRHGRPDVARASLSGLMDGYKGVKGKWKQDDDRKGVQTAMSPRVS
jgi:hypothetical protein